MTTTTTSTVNSLIPTTSVQDWIIPNGSQQCQRNINSRQKIHGSESNTTMGNTDTGAMTSVASQDHFTNIPLKPLGTETHKHSQLPTENQSTSTMSTVQYLDSTR
eukprot:3890703-Amphidinium_carterae.1